MMLASTNQPQTIAYAKAGHLFPKEFLETALRKCPTVSGYAIRDVSDGKTTLETDQYDRSVTVDNLMTINMQAEKFDKIFYMANITQNGLTNLKDDIQPYVLMMQDANNPDGEGISIVSFFVEGDFPQHSDSKSGHTDEYNIAHDVIIPMLTEYFEDVDGDIGKFTAKLHRPTFEKALMGYVGHRATFIFLPLEGDPIAFGTNTLGGEFEWGSTSQTHGFGTTANQEPEPITKAAGVIAAVKKKFDPFGKKGAETPAPSITTDDKGIHTVAKKEELKSSTIGPKGKVGVKPPPKLDGTARNRWIRLFNNNKLPDNHLNKDLVLWVDPDVAPFAQRQDLEVIQDIKNLEDEIRTGNKAKPSTPKDMPAAMKQAHAEIKKVNEEAGSYPPFVPIPSDAEMTADTKALAGFLDRDKVPSYLDIQKMEAKWATFSEKYGIPWEDSLRWLGDDLNNLSRTALILLLIQTRSEVIKRMTLQELVGTSTEKKVDKHVEAKAILKPDGIAAKRNLLFGKK